MGKPIGSSMFGQSTGAWRERTLTRLRQQKNKTLFKAMSYRAQEKPWHYIPVFDAIQNGGTQGLESATSFSTSTWRTVLGNRTPTHCAILPATSTSRHGTSVRFPIHGHCDETGRFRVFAHTAEAARRPWRGREGKRERRDAFGGGDRASPAIPLSPSHDLSEPRGGSAMNEHRQPTTDTRTTHRLDLPAYSGAK